MGALGTDLSGNPATPSTGDGMLLALILGALQQANSGSGTVPSNPGAPATNTGANNFATGQQSSTNTAALLLTPRPTRRGVTITNTDASNAVWIGGQGVSNATGHKIPAGVSQTVTATQAIYIVDNGAHAVVTYFEEYD